MGNGFIQMERLRWGMNIDLPLPLLGGLTAEQFMRRHWQKKPLLVRQAISQFDPPVLREKLFSLAALEHVESRLIQQTGEVWKMRQGPFRKRALPARKSPGWTLLVQGVDLHHDGAHELMQQFRFVPEARLDDLMISYASDGGGVGPHFDSYDVFLLQAQGRRRWRIGRQRNLHLRDDVPLKILAQFEPEREFTLEPGDMLYLPPRCAHDGIAEGECMTYSIGFRAPERRELAGEILSRLADDGNSTVKPILYRDAHQEAVASPAAIPVRMQNFAREALQEMMATPSNLERALGEFLTEPKPNVWFEPGGNGDQFLQGLWLDRRSRMMYDAHHVFINGESYRATGRDASLMRRLADQRMLSSRDLSKASAAALALLSSWCEAGWVCTAR